MSDIALMTLALVVVTSALAIATIVYVIIVRKQARQSDKHLKMMAIRSEIAMLMQKRYQVENDETQLRVQRAELAASHSIKPNKKAEEILDERHKQCKKTIDETAKGIEELEKELKKLGEEDC